MKKLKNIIQEAIKSSEQADEIKKIAKEGELDISKYDMDELIMGYEVEKEHGTSSPITNVTNDNKVETLKITLVHLDEVSDYYTKLKKYVENEEDINEEDVNEESVSKSQQRFMGQVHALQTGQLDPKDINKKYRDSIVKAATSMKKSDAKDFAQTKLKGLPEKKKKTNESEGEASKNVTNKLIVKSSVDNMTPDKIALAKKFISFCLKELGIKEPCKIHYTGKRGGPIKTTASFFPSDNEIWIYCKNRNMLGDILRSTAHEIRHLKQNLDDVLIDGSGNDGSEHENEANSFSGLMIRKFGKLYPKIYE